MLGKCPTTEAHLQIQVLRTFCSNSLWGLKIGEIKLYPKSETKTKLRVGGGRQKLHSLFQTSFSHKEWTLPLFFVRYLKSKKHDFYIHIVCITEKVIVQAVLIKEQKTNNHLNQKRTPESSLDGCSPPTLKAFSIHCFSKWTTFKSLREHKSQLECEGWV